MIVRLLARAVGWPRKHRYRCITSWRRAHDVVGVYQCRDCQDARQMDRWQVESILWERAHCRAGRNLTLSEAMQVWLSPEYTMIDCYEPGRMS